MEKWSGRIQLWDDQPFECTVCGARAEIVQEAVEGDSDLTLCRCPNLKCESFNALVLYEFDDSEPDWFDADAAEGMYVDPPLGMGDY
jgi:hypothetical protein